MEAIDSRQRKPALHAHSTPDPEDTPDAPTVPIPEDIPDPAHAPVQEPSRKEAPIREPRAG